MSSFFCAFKDPETFYKDKGQCWASMNFKHGNNATVARTGTQKGVMAVLSIQFSLVKGSGKQNFKTSNSR